MYQDQDKDLHLNRRLAKNSVGFAKPSQLRSRTALERQQGATLFEYLLWGALAAAVLFSAYSLFWPANIQQKAQSESANIMAIWQGASRLRDSAGYGNLTTSSMQIARAFPNGMSGARTGTVKHSWNGDVTVTGSTNQFVITYAALPAEVCVAIRPQIETTGAFFSITECSTSGPTDLAMSAR